MLFALLVLSLLGLVLLDGSAATPNDGVPLTLLSEPRAKCMDGTQSGYYIRPGIGENSTRFVINLEGGGECATEASCKSKLNGPLGSSKYFPKFVPSAFRLCLCCGGTEGVESIKKCGVLMASTQ